MRNEQPSLANLRRAIALSLTVAISLGPTVVPALASTKPVTHSVKNAATTTPIHSKSRPVR
jgi:hypothetical protein